MADLSKRVDIVELKAGNYRRWRNDLEVALILAQCLPAAEHDAKPNGIDQVAWDLMEKNSRAIVIKALRDEYWRVSAQDSTFEILRKIEDAYQPTSSLIAVLNICKFFTLSKGVAKPEEAVKEITGAFAEMQRSIQASDFLRNRVVIDESVRTAILAFSVEKTDPSAAQQIKERFERNAISFDQAISLIAEVRVTASTTSPTVSPFVGNVSNKISCDYCKGRHPIEKCWFKNPSLASDKVKAKGICRLCKVIGHHTKDCKKGHSSSSSKENNNGGSRKKHVFIMRHLALSTTTPSTSSAPPEIIVDSGCTTHMMYDRRLFSSYTDGPPSFASKVYTASGQALNVSGYGSVAVNIVNSKTKAEHTLEFLDVLHVPNLQENILSVAALDKKGLHLTTGQEKIIIRHERAFIASAFLCPATMQYRLSYKQVE